MMLLNLQIKVTGKGECLLFFFHTFLTCISNVVQSLHPAMVLQATIWLLNVEIKSFQICDELKR